MKKSVGNPVTTAARLVTGQGTGLCHWWGAHNKKLTCIGAAYAHSELLAVSM